MALCFAFEESCFGEWLLLLDAAVLVVSSQIRRFFDGCIASFSSCKSDESTVVTCFFSAGFFEGSW